MKTSQLAHRASSGGALSQAKPVSPNEHSAPRSILQQVMDDWLGKLILSGWLCIAATQAFSAPTVTLAWDANVEPDIAGYELSYGESSGSYSSSVDVGNTTTTSLTHLVEGKTYYFVVSAYDTAGMKSLPSSEVSHTITSSTVGGEKTADGVPKVIYVDSEEADGYAARYAIDGDPNTFWHTAWRVSSTRTPPPHELQIDLGSSQNLAGFRYLPRQDSYSDGNIGEYEFYVSSDSANWGKPVASGTFPNTKSIKEVLFTPKTGRFIRFRALTDANGGTYTNIAELTFIHASPPPPNSGPVATAGAVSTVKGVPVAITLTGTDPDGDALSFAIASSPSNGSLSGDPPFLVYTPSAGFHGEDSFTFRVNDGFVDSSPATVAVTVSNITVNAPPIAIASSVSTLKSTPVAITLTGTDSDGDTLQFVVVSPPSRGTLSGTSPNLIYTPSGKSTGSDSFTFVANDGTVNSQPATVSISITETLTAPTILSRSGWSLQYVSNQTAPEGLASYAFDGSPHTFWHSRSDSGLPHELQINLGAIRSVNGFKYLPRQDQVSVGNIGDYEFYVSMDGINWGSPVATGTFANSSDEKQVIFTAQNAQFVRLRALSEVNGSRDCVVAELNVLEGTLVNQPPSAVSKAVTTVQDKSLSVVLEGNDPEGGLISYSIDSHPTQGKLSGTPPNLTYTPHPGSKGLDQFTFRTNDGAVFSSPANVSISVEPVEVINSAPVFDESSLTAFAEEGKAFTGQVIATDPNGGQITFKKMSGPSWLTVSSNGSMRGTPRKGTRGDNVFTIRATNSAKEATTATLLIQVSAPNLAPVLASATITYPAGTENTAYVAESLSTLATDPEGDTITVSKVTGPKWLTIDESGNLSGTPPRGAAGRNIFRVRFTDALGASTNANLIIAIHMNALPLPWKLDRVGDSSLAGGARFAAGAFVISGVGSLSQTADESSFAWQTLAGDGEIIARVSRLANTGPNTRVGVMIRESLAANSKAVFFGVNGVKNYEWMHRSATGGEATTISTKAGKKDTMWLRLVRNDKTVEAYTSNNGRAWTLAGSSELNLHENCYIGLSVSSGDTAKLNSSSFSNVQIIP
jgi:hypothetical protein